MKLSIIGVSLGLFGLTVLGTFPAIAQCVQGDTSVQYNISGSRQKTQRTNNVKMESDPNCTGNASITRSVQGNIGGTNSVEQNREVEQIQRGGKGNRSGVSGSTVKIRSEVTVDVHNSADYYFDP
ncbi:MAG: hypothetical protein ACKO4S_01085 [Snowella sp.]